MDICKFEDDYPRGIGLPLGVQNDIHQFAQLVSGMMY